MNLYTRPIILCLLDYYLPGFKAGGPLRSISNMVDMLSDELDFRIITRDRDIREIDSYPLIKLNAWNLVGKSQVFYASPDRIGFDFIVPLIRETPHDVLYVNSFFSFGFSIQPLIARKLRLLPPKHCVIAPRGEFSKGALELKRIKKAIFISAALSIGLHKGVIWQASSEIEFDDIRVNMVSNSGVFAEQIVIAQDLVNLSILPLSRDLETHEQPHMAPLRIVFLSRISAKKNLHFLLQVLANVSSPILLDIFGPIEDQTYFDECNKLIGLLPEYINVSYLGEIFYADVLVTFRRYDLFAFPTLGENFGHVIIESLAAGTAVLVSDQTPWRGNEELGVQEISLLDPDAWAVAIDQWANLDASSLAQRRAAAKSYANRFLNADKGINQNLNLFLDLINRERMTCAE